MSENLVHFYTSFLSLCGGLGVKITLKLTTSAFVCLHIPEESPSVV